MPDNTPHDWVADATFWNEAWSKMDTQLAAHQRRRRALYFLPALALLLLLAGTLVLWNQTPDTPTTQQAIPEASLPNPTPSNGEAVATTRSPLVEDALPAVAPSDVKAPKILIPLVNSATRIAEGPEPVVTAPAVENTAPARGGTLPYVVDTVALVTFNVAYVSDVVLVASDEEAVNFQASPRKWMVTGGASQFAGGPRPGYFGQLTYHVPVGKWYLPLGLRVDRTYRNITAVDLSDLAKEKMNLQPPTVTGSPAFFNVSSRDITGDRELSTTALESRVGIGRRIGRRVNVSAGAGVSYVVGGRGPRAITLNSDPTTGYNAAADQLGSTRSFAASVSGNIATGFETPINRLTTTAWLGIGYRVGRRWQANLGLTQGIGRQYQEGVLSVPSTRWELGTGYTF